MSLDKLLSELKSQQVKIWVDDGKLRYRTLTGPLSAELRERIKPYRQDIIEYLQNSSDCQQSTRKITLADRQNVLPVSFAEERLWFISTMNSNKPVFQLFSAYRVSGGLHRQVFADSLSLLVTRHEILRTRYKFSDEGLTRCIDEPNTYPLQTLELTCSTTTSVEEVLREALLTEQSRKMDLTIDPGFDAKLISVKEVVIAVSFNFHHILYDDQSMSLLWRELQDIYTALSTSIKPATQHSQLQYADFASWQRKNTSEQFDQSLSFWKNQLHDAPQILELPKDYQRPMRPSYSGASVERVMGGEQLVRLDEACSRLSMTRYMFLLTVFSLLLHRYSGQSTVLIGSPVSNRHSDELQNVLGCFLDTLVLRADFQDGQTFDQLLEAVRAMTLSAFENQHVPFERIVDALNPDRTSSAHPIFQVMFNYLGERSKRTGFSLPDCEVTRISLSVPTQADFDLKLTVAEHEGQLKCHFLYSADLFVESTIIRMVDHFFVLMDSALNLPHNTVSSLSLLTAAERNEILYDWNSTCRPYPSDHSLVEYFEKQVHLTGNRTALYNDQLSLSYQDLNAQANQLAHYLVEKGVKAQSVVGVYLPRSAEVSVSLLAILKVNAVYLPLDASYPAARIEHMLSVSKAGFVISLEENYQHIGRAEFECICLDRDKSHLAMMSGSNLAVSTSADDLAYIIFTSGSTGTPKGVRVCHRQILNRLHWMWREYPFGEGEVSCQKTAISFVDSLWELLGPLLKGIPSVVLSDSDAKDPVKMLRSLKVHEVSRLWVVPTLLQVLVRAAREHDIQLPALNFIVASGELLPAQLARDVCDEWPQIALYNLYGTSEAWDSTWHAYRHSVFDDKCLSAGVEQAVPIGKPIDNTQTFILDDDLNPVPIGVTGQLCVGGDGLAEGLLQTDDPEAGGFIKSPWADDKRLYMTGDRARYTEDGVIVLVGREASSINIRGYRVNPLEIEHQLDRISEVEKAAVVQSSDDFGNTTLLAFLQMGKSVQEQQKSIAAQLRQHLKTQLPLYMIPNEFIVLDKLLLTPSGKVDRQALLELNWKEHVEWDNSGDEPRSELEAAVLDVWRRVLKKKTVGIHDNFFDVGGHSILAVSLFDGLNRLSKAPLELTTLFEASTVAEQAAVLSKEPSKEPKSSLVPISAVGDKPPLFFVPPSAGTGLNYRRLGAGLDDDQPVYTFNLSVTGGELERTEAIPTMATRLVSEMCNVQKDGPYVIGGMCFGGVVAWEMAQQLRLANKAVAGVILLDSSLPFVGPGWAIQRSRSDLSFIIRRNLRDLWAHRFSKPSIARVVQRFKSKYLNRWSEELRLYRELRHRHRKILFQYEADVCDVNALIICSREFALREHYIDRWTSLVGGHLHVDIIEDVTHSEMLTDVDHHMSEIGSKVQRYLDSDTDAKQ